MPFKVMKKRDAAIDHTRLLTSGGRGILRGIRDAQNSTGYGWDTPMATDEDYDPWIRKTTIKNKKNVAADSNTDLSKYAPYLVGVGVLVGAYYLISNS